MKTPITIILVILMLNGCTVAPLDDFKYYNLIDAQAMLETINKKYLINNTTIWVYAGSDDMYDYVYSYIPGFFIARNHGYEYYKVPKNTLYVGGERYPLNIKSQYTGENRVIYNELR